MIVHLLEWVSPAGVLGHVAGSITFRASLAALVALLLSVFFVGRLIRWFRSRQVTENVTLTDSAELAEMHSGKAKTPTMGGLGIVGALLASVLLFARLDNPYVLLGLFTVASLAGLGLWDDYIKLRVEGRKGLRIREKLGVQALLMTGVALALAFLVRDGWSVSLYVPLAKASVIVLPLALFVVFVVIILLSTLNAVNFTDGLDGLAAGCVAIAVVPLFILAYASGRADYAQYFSIPFIEGAGELAVFSGALVGAVLGFLWYNCFPAQIFMGDTGSLPLGGAVGFLACAVRQELLLLLVGGVFVAEGLSVVLQVLSFRMTGKRLFLIAPLHHRYQFLGWPESRITIRFWIAAFVCAAASIAILRV